MTRPDPGYGGTVYGAPRPAATAPAEPPAPAEAAPAPAAPAVPAQRAVNAAPVPAAGAQVGAELWSARAATSRGTIARPATRAAIGAESIAAAQVVAEAAAASTAVSDLTTRTAAAVPDPPRPGTVYGRTPGPRGTTVFAGRLHRLHIGWHSASLGALSLIGLPSPGTGLILGVDRDARPVPVRFFRPEPTRLTLVGGGWTGQLLVFRALALGATAIVLTADPAAWRGVSERATGVHNRVIVTGPEGRQRLNATAQQPILVINEGGLVDPTTAELGPWQTQLTVLHDLDERGVPAVQDSDLVLAGRLDPAGAALAGSALRQPRVAPALQQLDDGSLALLGPGIPRYVRVNASDAERAYLAGSRAA